MEGLWTILVVCLISPFAWMAALAIWQQLRDSSKDRKDNGPKKK